MGAYWGYTPIHIGGAVYEGVWSCAAKGVKSWVRIPFGALRYV